MSNRQIPQSSTIIGSVMTLTMKVITVFKTLIVCLSIWEVPLVNPQGIRHVRRGVLYPYSFKAHVWIHSDVQANLKKITEVLALNEEIDKATEKYGSQVYINELEPLIAIRKATYEDAINTVKDFIATVTEMGPEEIHQIVKRGVQITFDLAKFFGDFIQGVSNIFTSKKMDRIEHTQKDQSHRIQVLEEDVCDLHEDLETIRSNMTDHWIKENQKLALMNINLQYTKSLEKSTKSVRKITTGIIDLNNGHLSPSFVNITTADEVVSNLTKISSDQGMTSTVKKGVELYGQPVSFDMKRGKLRILATVDTFNPNQKMNMIELLKLPAYDLYDQMAFKLDSKNSFVAISEEQNSTYEAVIFDQEEFGKCKNIAEDKDAPELICDQMMIHTNASNTCLGSLVLGQSLDKCKVEIIENPEAEYQFLSDETLVLFLPQAEEVVIKCQNDTRVEMVAGIYRPLLTPDCSLTTKDFRFPARPIIPEVVVIQTLATVDMEMSLNSVNIELQIIPSRALPNFKDRANPNYKKTQHLSLQTNRDGPSNTNVEVFVIMFGIGLIIVTVLVFMIICFLACRSCKVTKKNLKDKTQGVIE